jgi:outer membrane lipoprotein-sorting protein
MGIRRVAAILALSCSIALSTSCVARRRVITRNKSTPSQALLTSDKNALLTRINNLYQSIQTLSITANMVPALGSVNKGKITEYKDVTAYVLFKKPDEIRIIGLYPVVRTTAFDMVSTGNDFRVYIPAKSRFIEGRNELTAPSPKKLENLRPKVFLDAMFVRPPGPKESTAINDFTDEDTAAYILRFIYIDDHGDPHIGREIWFERLTLNIARQIIYDPDDEIATDARYSEWTKYNGVPFPKVIDINRPKDEYGVVITVVKAEINKSITDEKFVLQQPEGTTLQVLGEKARQETPQPDAGASASRQKKNAK